MNVRPPEPKDRKLYAVERNARQRRLIRDAFTGSDHPLSPENVVAGARIATGAASAARPFNAQFVRCWKDGWLTVVELPGSKRLYDLAGKKHHHHIVCIACRRAYELDGCSIIEFRNMHGLPLNSAAPIEIAARIFKKQPEDFQPSARATRKAPLNDHGVPEG